MLLVASFVLGGNLPAQTPGRTFDRPAYASGQAITLQFAVAQAPSTNSAPSIAVRSDHSQYYPGQLIAISFQNGPGNPKDWVGVYPEGVAPGSVASTLWNYVDNSRQGQQALREGLVTFPNGLALAGLYDAYLLLNDGYSILAHSTFEVIDPSSPLVQTDKRTYLSKEPISVTFTNGPGNPKDWIGVYAEGQIPGAPGISSILWYYVDGTRNGNEGKSEGLIRFPSGLANPGHYVAYLLQNDGYDILAQETFIVSAQSTTYPRMLSLSPPDGASHIPPLAALQASITNGFFKVATNSIRLSLDEVPVDFHLIQQGDLITVNYTNSTLFDPGSSHVYRLIFRDEAANSYTHEARFQVANYRNIVLPPPLYFEDFDSTPEGELPTGWSQTSYTEIINPDEDLNNLDSATYARWTVVEAARFQGPLTIYSNDESTDYQRVLSVNANVFVNGQQYQLPLASGRFLMGNSGYRVGQSQFLLVLTPDYDLSGKTNVYLSYHSLWEQNQDSVGTVEYSIDQGQTWWPVVYMLDRDDVTYLTNGTRIEIDAQATLTTERGDVARYFDENGEEQGGSYGAFLAAPISQELAPYISPRVNDDPVESKRVELFRLPKADGRSTVRFRFAHAGTDSWYFGIDNFGLYSISETTENPPRMSIMRNASGILISWPTSVRGYILESCPSLSDPSWTEVSGVRSNSVNLAPSQTQYYRLRK